MKQPTFLHLFKELARELVYWVYWAIPKFPFAVVYGSPDLEDNALALQSALNATSLRKVVLLVVNPDNAAGFELAPKTIVVRKDSMRGSAWFLFAKYVFFTHRCFMYRFPSKVVSVNLWHGMPIKKVGWMLKGNRGYESRYSIATSDFWAGYVQKSLRPFGQTLVTGLPRNDRLFLPSHNLWQRLGLAATVGSKKTLGWLPTYRQSFRGEIRADGVESGNVFGLEGLSPEALNVFLKKQGGFAIVKPHPMAQASENLQLSNLLIINDQWLQKHQTSLYELLGQCSVLVSDISSVVVDYLLLNRPVIHLIPDLKEYQNSRGFSLEPLEKYLAGPLVTNSEELFSQLAPTLNGQDSHAAQRERVLQLFHKDRDNRSTSRLLWQLNLSPQPFPPMSGPGSEAA